MSEPTYTITRRDCDFSRGDSQCPARLRNGDDGWLNCRFVHGHIGPHKTAYINGTEWDEDVSSVPPLRPEDFNV